MRKLLKKNIVISGIMALCLLIVPSSGFTGVTTRVNVIHATTGKKQVDPGLKEIISELQSVFKYSSYKLLKTEQLNTRLNEKGQVRLPGKRTLIITPTQVKGQRIQYQINMIKNKKPAFKTNISLKNNRSITIGGPKYKKGHLLFNISGSL